MNFFLRVNFKCSIKEPRGFPSAGPTTTSCEAALSLWPAQKLLLVLPRELGGLQEPQPCQRGWSTAGSSRKSHYFRCRVKSALYKKTKARVFLCSCLRDRFGIDCCSSVPQYSQNQGRSRLELPFSPLYTGKALLAVEMHDPNPQHVSGPSALVNFYC